jgi:hypothetical protein
MNNEHAHKIWKELIDMTYHSKYLSITKRWSKSFENFWDDVKDNFFDGCVISLTPRAYRYSKNTTLFLEAPVKNNRLTKVAVKKIRNASHFNKLDVSVIDALSSDKFVINTKFKNIGCECGYKTYILAKSIKTKYVCYSCIGRDPMNLKLHGLSIVWTKIIADCHDPESPDFKNFGALGTKVVDTWHTQDAFIKDMSPGFMASHMLYRNRCDQGFYKQNCKWWSGW